MAAHADLWGDIAPSAVRTPASILREQASLLGAKTKNTIEGQVETWTSGSKLYHSFNLVVPALDNYSYELFKISHGFPNLLTDARSAQPRFQSRARFCVISISYGWPYG